MSININFKVFSTTNIIIALSLIVILLLVFLKNQNFELFETSSTAPQEINTIPITTTTKPTTTKPTTTKPTTTKPTTTKPTTTKSNTTKTTTTLPATTIPLLSNDVIQNSYLVNFINRFIINKNQQNIYSSTLTDRQSKINDLSEQVIGLINPSS